MQLEKEKSKRHRLKALFGPKFGSYVIYFFLVILFFGLGQMISHNCTEQQQFILFCVVAGFACIVILYRMYLKKPILP
jgi:hypothetical protein